MNYGRINKTDIANGPGVRVSLFVSGCRNRCKGCFNPETWDFNYGEKFTDDTIKEIIDALSPDHITGLSILGGEPLDTYNMDKLVKLCLEVRRVYPNKTIWVYTGYTYEKVWTYAYLLLRLCDVLVDGPYMESQKDISLKFRGSKNQRIIDLKNTKSPKNIKLWRLQDE